MFWLFLIFAAVVVVLAMTWVISLLVGRGEVREEEHGSLEVELLELQELLLKLFTATELRRFLHLRLGGGYAIARELGTGLPDVELAFSTVVSLEKRGLLRRALFDELVMARPLRAEEIRKVER